MTRLESLLTIAETHPDMPLCDAMTATAHVPDSLTVEQHVHYDERQAWRIYAACVLPGLVRVDSTAAHATKQAAMIADAMVGLEKQRFEGAP